MTVYLKCSHAEMDAICRNLLPEHQDDLMGIPVVLTNAVVQRVCGNCGEVLSTIIPDLEGLRAAMAIMRVNDPLKLNGKEICFLRKALGYTGKELAGKMQVAAESVSRWENNRELMRPMGEKLLRLIVGGVLATKAPAVDFDADEIVNMRIQSVRAQEDITPILLEWVALKMPKQPKSQHWGLRDKAA